MSSVVVTLFLVITINYFVASTEALPRLSQDEQSYLQRGYQTKEDLQSRRSGFPSGRSLSVPSSEPYISSYSFPSRFAAYQRPISKNFLPSVSSFLPDVQNIYLNQYPSAFQNAPTFQYPPVDSRPFVGQYYSHPRNPSGSQHPSDVRKSYGNTYSSVDQGPFVFQNAFVPEYPLVNQYLSASLNPPDVKNLLYRHSSTFVAPRVSPVTDFLSKYLLSRYKHPQPNLHPPELSRSAFYAPAPVPTTKTLETDNSSKAIAASCSAAAETHSTTTETPNLTDATATCVTPGPTADSSSAVAETSEPPPPNFIAFKETSESVAESYATVAETPNVTAEIIRTATEDSKLVSAAEASSERAETSVTTDEVSTAVTPFATTESYVTFTEASKTSESVTVTTTETSKITDESPRLTAVLAPTEEAVSEAVITTAETSFETSTNPGKVATPPPSSAHNSNSYRNKTSKNAKRKSKNETLVAEEVN